MLEKKLKWLLIDYLLRHDVSGKCETIAFIIQPNAPHRQKHSTEAENSSPRVERERKSFSGKVDSRESSGSVVRCTRGEVKQSFGENYPPCFVKSIKVKRGLDTPIAPSPWIRLIIFAISQAFRSKTFVVRFNCRIDFVWQVSAQQNQPQGLIRSHFESLAESRT